MRGKAKWVVAGVAALLVLNVVVLRLASPEKESIQLSAALNAIDSKQVRHATVSTRRVVLVLSDGRRLSSDFPATYIDDLIALLHRRGVPFDADSGSSGSLAGVLLLLPFVLFGLFWRWLARRLPRPS
jgi:hypothetical protein